MADAGARLGRGPRSNQIPNGWSHSPGGNGINCVHIRHDRTKRGRRPPIGSHHTGRDQLRDQMILSYPHSREVDFWWGSVARYRHPIAHRTRGRRRTSWRPLRSAAEPAHAYWVATRHRGDRLSRSVVRRSRIHRSRDQSPDRSIGPGRHHEPDEPHIRMADQDDAVKGGAAELTASRGSRRRRCSRMAAITLMPAIVGIALLAGFASRRSMRCRTRSGRSPAPVDPRARGRRYDLPSSADEPLRPTSARAGGPTAPAPSTKRITT